MLPKIKMVRKILESFYEGTCRVIEQQKVKKPNGSTSFSEVIVLDNQPCRLSFDIIRSTKETETASKITQVARLFLAPDVEVKPGSKVIVTQYGVTVACKASGQPAIHSNHQEIILEPFDGWA